MFDGDKLWKGVKKLVKKNRRNKYGVFSNFVWWHKKLTHSTDGVVFYVGLPMHYAMFANVHKHLPNARIVARDQRVAEYLHSIMVEYTFDKLYPDIIIMADYYQGEYPILGIKKIQLFHGVGCKNYIDGNRNREYLCLVPGENMERRLKSKGTTNVNIVGYPKTDCFFDGSIDRNLILCALNFDPSRKTILYSPTWGEMSSAPLLSQTINELGKKYNVIVKLHDLAIPEWREIYRQLQWIKFCEDSNITTYMFAADMLISDFSSTIFEFSQLHRPIISFITNQTKIPEKANDVSWWNITKLVSEINQLASTVDEMFLSDWQPSREYIELVDSIFAFRDGQAGLRTAEKIKELEER